MAQNWATLRAKITAVYDDTTQRWLDKQLPVSTEMMAQIKSGELTMEDARSKWNAVAKLASFQVGERHLDVGCGAALLALPQLRKAQTQYHGLDLSHLTLTVTAQRAQVPFVLLGQGDALRLPYPDQYFSVITAIGFSEYLPPSTLVTFFKEINRVLAISGRLVMDFLDAATHGADHTRIFEAGRGLTVFTPSYADVDNFLAKTGLQITRSLSFERRVVHRIQRGF